MEKAVPQGCRSLGRVVGGILALLMVSSGLSCHHQSVPGRPVYPVHGQVLLDGKAVPNALVVFHPVEKWGAEENRPRAQTDSEGRFTVSTYGTHDGAPAGEYKVTISELREAGEQTDDGSPAKRSPNPPPVLYANPETSGLRVTISERRNDLEPFRLKPGKTLRAKPSVID